MRIATQDKAWFPRTPYTGNPYKIALPSFYFTAVTVRRGTISVDGVQNYSKSSRKRLPLLYTTLPVGLPCSSSNDGTLEKRRPAPPQSHQPHYTQAMGELALVAPPSTKDSYSAKLIRTAVGSVRFS